VDADPIRCWWRTSANAVRVGESFSLTLTCAIVENDTTTVVPDQSRLDPSAMQLPPFEVIGGQREPDLRTDSRRFFQYQYTLRLISEEMFGKDAKIPSLQIAYHVESKVERGETVERAAVGDWPATWDRCAADCCPNPHAPLPALSQLPPGELPPGFADGVDVCLRVMTTTRGSVAERWGRALNREW